MDVDIPLFPTFKVTPGKILIRLKNLNPILLSFAL
jgi:hypothetical protein